MTNTLNKIIALGAGAAIALFGTSYFAKLSNREVNRIQEYQAISDISQGITDFPSTNFQKAWDMTQEQRNELKQSELRYLSEGITGLEKSINSVPKDYRNQYSEGSYNNLANQVNQKLKSLQEEYPFKNANPLGYDILGQTCLGAGLFCLGGAVMQAINSRKKSQKEESQNYK